MMEANDLLSEEDLFIKGLNDQLTKDLQNLDDSDTDGALGKAALANWVEMSLSTDAAPKLELLDLARMRSESCLSTASDGNSSRGSTSPRSSPLVKRERADLTASPKRSRKTRPVWGASPLAIVDNSAASTAEGGTASWKRRQPRKPTPDAPFAAMSGLQLSGEDSPSGSPANSRKNKLQRCSLCGALGHKSRTCQNSSRMAARVADEGRNHKLSNLVPSDKGSGPPSRQTSSPKLLHASSSSERVASDKLLAEERVAARAVASEDKHSPPGIPNTSALPPVDDMSWKWDTTPPPPVQRDVSMERPPQIMGVTLADEGLARPIVADGGVENLELRVRAHSQNQGYTGTMVMNTGHVPVAMPTTPVNLSAHSQQLHVETAQSGNIANRRMPPSTMIPGSQAPTTVPAQLSLPGNRPIPQHPVMPQTQMSMPNNATLSVANAPMAPPPRAVQVPQYVPEYATHHQQLQVAVQQNQMMQCQWEQQRQHAAALPHSRPPVQTVPPANAHPATTAPSVVGQSAAFPTGSYMQLPAPPPPPQQWHLQQWQMVQHTAGHPRAQMMPAPHLTTHQQQVSQAPVKWARAPAPQARGTLSHGSNDVMGIDTDPAGGVRPTAIGTAPATGAPSQRYPTAVGSAQSTLQHQGLMPVP